MWAMRVGAGEVKKKRFKWKQGGYVTNRIDLKLKDKIQMWAEKNLKFLWKLIHFYLLGCPVPYLL